jgi:hypothetical protein
MKPQQTAPLLTALAPAALSVPPVAIVGALLGGLLWLLSSNDKPDQKQAHAATPSPDPVGFTESKTRAPVPLTPPASAPSSTIKRVTREDLAEALAYGARQFTLKEAVAALEALGFRKTAAYKALSHEGKFSSLMQLTPDGLVEWKG